MTDINETIAEVLRIDAQATPGPWYPQATDDRLCMNASYVSTDPKSGLRDMDPQSAERDCRPGSVVAITLLQSPRLANVRDQRWDENTDLITYYRSAAPALAREAQRLQEQVSRLLDARTIDRLRAHGDGYQDGHRAGQEAMRERCAAISAAVEAAHHAASRHDRHHEGCRDAADEIESAIRALEVPHD